MNENRAPVITLCGWGLLLAAAWGGFQPSAFATTEAAAAEEVAWPIVQVLLRGAHHQPEAEVLKLIGIPPGTPLARRDLSSLYRRLMASGRFRSVSVVLSQADDGHRLVVTVDEFPLLRQVIVNGPHPLEAPTMTALSLLEGQPATDQHLRRAFTAVEDSYRRAGYVEARVAVHRLTPEGVLHLAVDPGRLDAVSILGHVNVSEGLITREMTTRPGTVLRSEALQGDLNRLMQTQTFERIETRYEREGGLARLRLEVKEAPAMQLTDFLLGYNKDLGWMLGAGIVHWNVLGTGTRLGVSAFPAPNFQGHAAFVQPWADEQRTALGGMVYTLARPNPAGNFREDRSGVHAFGSRPLWGPPLATPFRATAGLRVEQIAAFENYLADARPIATYQDGRRVTLSDQGRDMALGAHLGLAYDTRWPLQGDERYASPRDGWLNGLTLEPGLINGVSPVVKLTGALTRFIPVPSPFGPATLAFSGRAGGVWGASVPAYKRFYSDDVYHDGWSTSPTGFVGIKPMFLIRGASFSPPAADSKTYLLPMNYFSGAHALVGSVEYRFPIWSVVSGVAFLDAGGFWDQQYDPGLLHIGYGPGLRIQTPLGLLRLDLGISGYIAPQLTFGIGQQF